MIGEVRVTGYGREAAAALAALVAAAKEGRPLAPVTVVVPGNLAGLSARRGLGGTGRGVANVAFITPFRLAEMLAADQLGGLRPLTNPVLGAAVRRALEEAKTPLGDVATHHATEQAFAALYTELAQVSEPTLVALSRAGSGPALAVEVYRGIAEHLAGFAGENEVVRAAARRPDLHSHLAAFGQVVWYLPEPVTPALAGLMGRVLDEAPSSAVVGLCGVDEADEPVRAVCARAGLTVPDGAVAPPVASAIVSVTDADEEVRAVVRRVVAMAEAGVPLDRIGVFHPSPDPYARTLAQQLEAAGIPANGPSRERLADGVAGRTLLAALALPHERWRRDRVMALVSGAPLRHGDQRVSPARWEDLSRVAGVVQDLADWDAKLTGLAGAIDRRAAEDGPAAARREGWRRRTLADIEALKFWIDDLAGAVGDVEVASGWAGKAAAAGRLLHQVLGSENRRQGWEDKELEAAARVEDALSRLATLDEIEPDPTTPVFRRALQAELDVARGRTGRHGQGVLYGPLSAAVGQDLDAVFIVGLAEGQCPAPRAEDALLPDAARALAAPGELAQSSRRLTDQHRLFLAALSSAPDGSRVLTYPRGDLRGGRHRLPSRWLMPSASALAGKPVYSTDFPKLGAPVVTVVPSYAAGVGGGGDPEAAAASLVDRDQAAVRAFVAAGGDPASHPATAGLSRAFACVAGRASTSFTEWDGNLAGLPVPSPASGRLLSATGLQEWAACGQRYFLAHVLGLRPRDDPERIRELGALDRGSALHKVLERFFANGAADPDRPWSEADRGHLADIADEVFAELEATGRTGRPLLWRLERQQLGLLLEGFLTADDAHRRATRSRPVRVEMPFGRKGAGPVTITLPDGRVIPFTGSADRVDQDDAGHCHVSDYKSGKGSAYKGLDLDPVLGGTALQLGLYSEAALQLLGATGAAAHYWQINDEVRFARIGYEWAGPVRERFLQVVAAIVAGIEAGAFPAVPGEWDTWLRTNINCRYCAFDDLCPRDRGDFALAKAGAAELRLRDPLGLPVPEDGP